MLVLHLLNTLGDLGHCEVLVAIVDRHMNLLPSIRRSSAVKKDEAAARKRELRAGRADHQPAVAAEVGDRPKSGISRPVSHISSMLRWVSCSSRRLDWIRLRPAVDSRSSRSVTRSSTARPTGHLRHSTRKAQRVQVEFVVRASTMRHWQTSSSTHAEVFQAVGQQRAPPPIPRPQ